MGHKLVMRCLEVIHIRLEQAHIRRRLVIDAQQVDADIAFLIRIRPTFDGRINLELRLLILRDGVETCDMVIAKAFGNLIHAILLIELQLRDGLDKAEVDLARFHLIDSRLQGLWRTERLLTGEDDFRDIKAIQTVKDGFDIVRRAVVIIAWTCKDMETGIVDRFHLIGRHAEIHLEE